MPSALRAQVALIALFGVLLIPIGTSSLRGLTHVLSCRGTSATPFSVEVVAGGPPVVSGSTVIERNPDGSVDSRELCGGLTLDLMVGSHVEDEAEVTLAITNRSDVGWHGTVQLRLDDTLIPLAIGAIGAGDTATEDLPLHLDAGRTYALEGTLLIGP